MDSEYEKTHDSRSLKAVSNNTARAKAQRSSTESDAEWQKRHVERQVARRLGKGLSAAANSDARSKSLKWPHLYDILRSKGYDKSKAAAISNSRTGMRKNGRVKVLGARAAHNPRVLANLKRAVDRGQEYKPGKSY